MLRIRARALCSQSSTLATDRQLERSFDVSGMIAGFGFSTIQRRDLSDLDDILARIEDLGATHAELSLGGADLVCGGRILRPPVDRLAPICAPHPLAHTAPR